MGGVWSYFTRKSITESDTLIASSADTETEKRMAEASNPRDAGSQHNARTCYSREDFSRYINALQVCLEFLNNSGSIVERQRMLETELETCHERLRRFTEDHARVSESGSENISSSNRPSALEGNYQNFYDHERMDAVDCIESLRKKKEPNKRSGIEDQRVACLIFEESFAAAQTLRQSFLEGIAWILKSAPTIGAQYANGKATKDDQLQFSVGKPGRRQVSPLGPSDINSLKVIMKETAETCDVEALLLSVYDALRRRQENGRLSDYKKDFFYEPTMTKYVEKCCRYAWKLVCQTPPYLIEGNYSKAKSSKVFDPAVHQICREFEATEHNSGYISLVVWPGLFEGSSARVIRKTEVVLQ